MRPMGLRGRGGERLVCVRCRSQVSGVRLVCLDWVPALPWRPSASPAAVAVPQSSPQRAGGAELSLVPAAVP